jgi:hypothetical protein
MTVTNTQLAAALVSLGHDMLPIAFDSQEIVFEFPDDVVVTGYQSEWRQLSHLDARAVIGNAPLEIMFRMSKARQWVLKQVVHGHHNSGLTLPAQTLATPDLDLAIALVANGCYLLKLDRPSRLFHFSETAAIEKTRYEEPSEWYSYARMYLSTLGQLVRKINNRNLTRQENQHAITSRRVMRTPYPTQEYS